MSNCVWNHLKSPDTELCTVGAKSTPEAKSAKLIYWPKDMVQRQGRWLGGPCGWVDCMLMFDMLCQNGKSARCQMKSDTLSCSQCHDHLTLDQETATPVASQLYSSTPVSCKHSQSWTRTLGVTLGLNSFLTYCLYYTSLSILPWPCYILRSPSSICVIYLVLFSPALVLTFLQFSFVWFLDVYLSP